MAFDTTTSNDTPLMSQEEASPAVAPVRVEPQAKKSSKAFPDNLSELLDVFIGQDGRAYIAVNREGNTQALLVGGEASDSLIREIGSQHKERVRDRQLKDINEDLRAHAVRAKNAGEVWVRVASTDAGIEIDVGDADHTRIQITDGHVKTVSTGSKTNFYRPKASMAMPLPAQHGDLSLLRKYLNLDDASAKLFTAWLSYTLVHPKVDTSKFVILVLNGGKGSGKTLLCKNIIQTLVDPSRIGVQSMCTNPQDLAVATMNAHVVIYDNLRSLSNQMSDALCMTSTGGAMSGRALYTDNEQAVTPFHGALVLNGIHAFITQADLADRCLTLNLEHLSAENRQPDDVLQRQLAEDMPEIFAGLLQQAAKALKVLPQAVVTHPERMIEFCRWLAAIEIVEGVEPGTYQQYFSESLVEGQSGALESSLFATHFMTFANSLGGAGWKGTPSELSQAVECKLDARVLRDPSWPRGPIALSKQLKELKSSLETQGVHVTFSRGKLRQITVFSTNSSAVDDDNGDF